MSTKKPQADEKKQLRLKKLAERTIDPADLAQVNGGQKGSTAASRYCGF
jgi:hypothetical protein